MTLGIIIAILLLVLLWYVLWGRACLKTKPWAAGFFAAIEPVEILLFRKSEAILWARTKMAIGAILTLLTFLGSIDLTPIMPFVPDAYAAIVRNAFNLLPMLITLVGLADERVRNRTTMPIELVALPDKVVADNPRVAEAVAMAAATKTEAVAVVADAKAA